MIPTSHELTKSIGIQYFPGPDHTSGADALRWFPLLEKLNIKWLIVNSELKKAIPESFVRKLLQTGINPVLRFQLSLVNPPRPSDLEPLFSAYSKWGIQYVSFFEQPNQFSSWSPETWVQNDLVERFIDRFLTLAKPALAHHLIPVFSPLFPGGNYWDTLFLEQALKSVERRQEFELLDQLVLSAYGWTFDHPLIWGEGGPEKWPMARPYTSLANTQDHRGFRIFDWYTTISKNVLGRELPIFLFESGLPGPEKNQGVDPNTLAATYQEILNSGIQQLEGDSSSLTIFFSLLSADDSHPEHEFAWFNLDGSITALGERITSYPQKSIDTKEFSPSDKVSNQIDTYLLLPSFEWGVADWHLDMVRSFVKKNRPTLGFSLQDASLAKKVIVIGSENDFSEDELIQLRLQGCSVDRIQGDGTSIATQLAER
jgi:hypothetical protein